MGSQHRDAALALVIGESLVDLTRYPDGSESVRAGGSPLNVAVGLSRLDVITVLASQIGDDEYGDLLRDHIDASDVDLRSLPPHHDETATALARVDAAGVATYQFDLEWDPSELPVPSGFDVVHVGSIGIALAPGADAVAALVADAHAGGIPVSLDPNVRPAVTPDLEDGRRRFTLLAPHTRFCKLSDEDAALLYPGDAVEVVGERVLGLGPRLVAVTLGDQGALLVSDDDLVRVPPAPADLRDTIGAGDSFMAALLAALAGRGWLRRDTFTADDLRWLGEIACTAAALTCSRSGAHPPYLTELGAHVATTGWF